MELKIVVYEYACMFFVCQMLLCSGTDKIIIIVRHIPLERILHSFRDGGHGIF
jgi:hypothetical protein